jgi:hypothetical protein
MHLMDGEHILKSQLSFLLHHLLPSLHSSQEFIYDNSFKRCLQFKVSLFQTVFFSMSEFSETHRQVISTSADLTAQVFVVWLCINLVHTTR